MFALAWQALASTPFSVPLGTELVAFFAGAPKRTV